MQPLRILALAKQIPVFEDMRLGADKRLVRDSQIQHMNDYCRRAVAAGKQLAEQTEGSLAVMTMGPPSAETVCREALLFGADRGFHICDEAFAGSDTLATARALAEAVELVGPFDLILCGLNSLDADTGQVPPQLAQLLGLPFAAGVRRFELLSEGTSTTEFWLELEHDDELCEAQLTLPAVLSCAERLCDPCKIKDPEAWAQADGSLITKLSADDLGPGPWGQAGSPTYVGDIKTVNVSRQQVRLDFSPQAIAEVVDFCRQRGVLDAGVEVGTGVEVGAGAGAGAEAGSGCSGAPDTNSADTNSANTNSMSPPSLPPDAAGIAVLIEPDRQQLTRELLGAAARLAQQSRDHGTPPDSQTTPPDSQTTPPDRQVMALGPQLPSPPELAKWGATQGVELVANHEFLPEEDVAWAVSDWLRQRPNVWAVLAPGTAWGRQVASRIAATLDAGLVGDAIGLAVGPAGQSGNEPSDNLTAPPEPLPARTRPQLIADKPAFGGFMVAEIGCRSDLQMATVRAGVLAPREFGQSEAGQTELAQAAAMSQLQCEPVSRIKIKSKVRADDSAELANAQLVIGVGQGVAPDKYPLLEKLRQKLGAALCATRKVTDQGWMPRARQVGITGHTISPRLFISVGSSGKFNHTVGVRTAEVVLAINRDPQAPIFEVCDMGIVGDWEQVLPPLAKALAASCTP